MSVGEIISTYYAFAFTIVILIFSIILNTKMTREVKYHFAALVFLSIAECIMAAIETHLASLSEPHIARFILSTVLYALRPYLMYLIIVIMLRDKPHKVILSWGIPLLIFDILIYANLFKHFIFTISEDNTFVALTLHPLTYLILIFYLMVIIGLNIRHIFKKETIFEAVTLIIGVSFIALNIVGCTFIPDYQDQNEITIALAILSYGIFFKSQSSIVEKKRLITTEANTNLFNENGIVGKINRRSNEGKLNQYAFLYFDVVRFSDFNKTYGIENGDKIMQAYAKYLKGLMQKHEYVARFTGDRFCMIIRKEHLQDILESIEKVSFTLELNGEEEEIFIGACIGVFEPDLESMTGADVIACGVHAHDTGKNITHKNITYFTKELKQTIENKRRFEADIPIALEKEEFLTYYQPKVNSKTKQLCGAEALVRWIHDGELLSPGLFIPVMESNDLMCQFDYYMLRHVCADLAKWIGQGLVPPTVSVNFSRRNLSNDHLAEDIDEIVTSYHVPKKMIQIEITETIDEFPISVMKDFVDRLHELGYSVAVDDFGSGSSSLSLLREITFDTLKIDKGFVDRAYAKDLTILNYMIKLALALNVEVLAEGVEQKEQVVTLSSLGCDIIQGYYYDKPLPREEFEKRIMRGIYDDN